MAVNEWVVCILLECILVSLFTIHNSICRKVIFFTPVYDSVHRGVSGQTPPSWIAFMFFLRIRLKEQFAQSGVCSFS